MISGVPALRYFTDVGDMRQTNPFGLMLPTFTNVAAFHERMQGFIEKEAPQLFTGKNKSHWLSIINGTSQNVEVNVSKTTVRTNANTLESLHRPIHAYDMFKSLSMLLRSDVSMVPQISHTNRTALSEFLNMLIKVLPCPPTFHAQLKALYQWVSDHDRFSGTQWINKMKQINFPLFPGDHVTCKGSLPRYRGYPCGLWLLFHSLTVNHYKLSQTDSSLPGDLVAHALNRFMPLFFSCHECAFHFAANTANIARPGESLLPDRSPPNPDVFKWDPAIIAQLPQAPKTAKEEVLWLNRVHNRVNLRLSGSITEDPTAPKIVYPPRNICQPCWSQTTSGEWKLGATPTTENELLNFLLNRFDSTSWMPLPPDTISFAKDMRFSTVEAEDPDNPDLFTVALISVAISLMALFSLLIISRFFRRCRKARGFSYKLGHTV